MVTHWHNINYDIIFDTLLWVSHRISFPHLLTSSEPFDQFERSSTSMSTFSCTTSTSPSFQLTSSEFRNMVTSADTLEIFELLHDHPQLLPHYLHFSSLSRTLKRQELIQQATQEELDMAFDDMKNYDFYDAFSFFIARKRNEQQRVAPRPQSPYRCPTPFSGSSESSPPPSYSPYTDAVSGSASSSRRTPSPIDDPRPGIVPLHCRRSLNGPITYPSRAADVDLETRELEDSMEPTRRQHGLVPASPRL
jgi:hypothetical protein